MPWRRGEEKQRIAEFWLPAVFSCKADALHRARWMEPGRCRVAHRPHLKQKACINTRTESVERLDWLVDKSLARKGRFGATGRMGQTQAGGIADPFSSGGREVPANSQSYDQPVVWRDCLACRSASQRPACFCQGALDRSERSRRMDSVIHAPRCAVLKSAATAGICGNALGTGPSM